MLENDYLLKFDKDCIEKIQKNLEQDNCFLSQFDLMDYSLLLCITFNPNFMKKYPEKF